jgi:hypothetical protein
MAWLLGGSSSTLLNSDTGTAATGPGSAGPRRDRVRRKLRRQSRELGGRL